MKLEGNVAIGTGVGTGVGRAIALAFAGYGCSAAVNHNCLKGATCW